jgi:putative transposase
MACLYHSILPKPNVRALYGTQNGWDAHGVMWRLIVDRARQLSGHDLKDACNGLGITLIPAPPREPQFKAEVEAEIKALNYMLFHKLPGTTFANPKQRGRYDSMGTACVYISQIDEALNTFICDIFTQRKHRGINAVPAQRWKRLTSDPNFVWPLPPDAGTLEILLSRVAQRSLQHYGFDLFGLRYNCPDLGALRAELPKRENIRIKYRPDDMGHVWVYNRFNGSYIKVPANHQEYAQHLSLYKHRVLRKAAQELEGSVDHVALGRAKRKLREIVQQGRDRKATSTRARQKRLETNGRPTRELSSEPTVDTPANAQGNATSPQTSAEPVAPRLPPGVTSISDIQLDRVPEGWGASNSLPSQRVEGSEKPPREEASEPATDTVQPQNQESVKPVEPARSAPNIQLDGVPEGWGVSKPKTSHSRK